jgi:hypothetical protein
MLVFVAFAGGGAIQVDIRRLPGPDDGQPAQVAVRDVLRGLEPGGSVWLHEPLFDESISVGNGLIWREGRGVMLATRGLASAVIRRPAHCTPPRGTLPPARVRGRATSCGIRIDTGVALLTTRARPRPSVTTAGTHTIHAHIWRGVPRLPNRIPRSVAFRAPSATAQRYGSRRWPSSSSTSAATTARTSGRIPSGGR